MGKQKEPVLNALALYEDVNSEHGVPGRPAALLRKLCVRGQNTTVTTGRALRETRPVGDSPVVKEESCSRRSHGSDSESTLGCSRGNGSFHPTDKSAVVNGFFFFNDFILKS